MNIIAKSTYLLRLVPRNYSNHFDLAELCRRTISPCGDSSITHDSLSACGYNSVMIPRPCGTEYVVYDHTRVHISTYNANYHQPMGTPNFY